MYAETGLLFPCFQNYSQDVQQYEDLWRAQKANALISNLVSSGSSMISEYDLGGEGDLFKAPEAIMVDNIEPMMMSMMSSGEAMMSSQEADDQLLSEVLYECEKDLLEQAAMEIPLYEPLEIKVPTVSLDEISSFQKSVSFECLSSMDWAYHHQHGGPALTAPLPEEDEGFMDISASMRRAFSEGDIKTLGSGNGEANGSSVVQSPRPTMVIGKSISEERREQLSRYRTKKSKRNFGRKIKYACRKALADSQPRIRGRFARTEY